MLGTIMELRKFPHHIIFIEQAKYGLQNYLLFELLTRTGQAVYFKHPIFHTPNKEMRIVFVQDHKFYPYGKTNNLIKEWDKSSYTQEDFIAIKLNTLAKSIYETCNR